jgi:hypothetical protein
MCKIEMVEGFTFDYISAFRGKLEKIFPFLAEKLERFFFPSSSPTSTKKETRFALVFVCMNRVETNYMQIKWITHLLIPLGGEWRKEKKL